MKKLFTKLIATTMFLLMGVLNVYAQTLTYSGTYPITLQGFTQSITDPIAAGWAGTTSSPTTSARNGKCFTTANDGNFNTGKFITYRVPSCGTITLQANGTVGRGFIVTVTKVSDASQLSRTVWAYSNATCSSQDFVVNSSVPVNITILSPSAAEGAITSTGSSYISYVNISGLATPTIKTFVAAGITATINETLKTITAELPYGTDLSSITPVVTVGGTATGYSPSGSQNFSTGSVNYTATDGTTNTVYAVTLTVPATIPAPVFTISSGSTNQALKAGTAMTDIVYSLTNATGAGVTGLPTGLSGNFVSSGTNTGTFTISGTVDAGVTPGLFNYIVTAGSIPGYSGVVITATGSVLVKSPVAKQILYLTATGTVSATDTKLYPMLNNSTNYIVTLKLAGSAAPLASVYDPYDLIVLNESVASANAEAAALKSVDKPILNLKSFVYAASPKWGWGTPDNGSATNLAIAVKQPLHPIFNGITLNAGSMDVLSAVSGSKGIQPADITLLGSINVATAPKAASGTAVAIHDVPAAIRGVVNSRYLMVPISDLSYGNFTNDAVLLLSNAVDYLLNGTQFVVPNLQISSFTVNNVTATIDNTAGTILAILPIGTDLTALQPTIVLTGVGTEVSPLSGIAKDFTISESTPISYTVTDGINSKVYAVTIKDATTGVFQNTIQGVTFDGKVIRNSSNLTIQVFDITGRMVARSTKNIDMSSMTKGIYMVKSTSGSFKIVL